MGESEIEQMSETVSTEPSDVNLAEMERLINDDGQVRNAFVVLVGDHFENPDGAASLMVELLEEDGYSVDAVVSTGAVKREIRKALNTAVVGGADLVVTVGGVGVGPRAKTPDATRKVLDVRLQGIEQAIRNSGMGAGALDAGLSRGLAGVSGQTVIINLAESRAAVRDGMATILPLVSHVLDDLCRWSV
uniref:MogA/MoaB family molybdenum cofactor biosynthesis protein n=1 Tax=Corynebacterium amycolatum TaxID=43765 RepID=UPI003CCBD78A